MLFSFSILNTPTGGLNSSASCEPRGRGSLRPRSFRMGKARSPILTELLRKLLRDKDVNDIYS